MMNPQYNLRESPPLLRRVAAMVVDAVIVLESFLVAFLLRFNGDVPTVLWPAFCAFAIFGAAIFVASLYASGIYHHRSRVAFASCLAVVGILIADVVLGRFLLTNPMPLSAALLGSLLAYIQLRAIRFAAPLYSAAPTSTNPPA